MKHGKPKYGIFNQMVSDYQNVDVLRTEMRLLQADLRQQDAKAQAGVARFRDQAKAAQSSGNKLPGLPPELHQCS